MTGLLDYPQTTVSDNIPLPCPRLGLTAIFRLFLSSAGCRSRFFYDNDWCLVAKVLPNGSRKRTKLFSGFLSFRQSGLYLENA
jgi:hypothetical protein